MMNTRSRHALWDVWLETPPTEAQIERLLVQLREKVRVVKEVRHRFEPQGETILFLLAESHFALHTYPEHAYLSLDLYLCDARKEARSILRAICSELKVIREHYREVERG
jgi:S-adenosylmethionine/arginine decarboxylase-like enzyme